MHSFTGLDITFSRDEVTFQKGLSVRLSVTSFVFAALFCLLTMSDWLRLISIKTCLSVDPGPSPYVMMMCPSVGRSFISINAHLFSVSTMCPRAIMRFGKSSVTN